MKNLILFIFLTFCNICFSVDRIENIKYKKIINNIVYFKNEASPFSGKFIGKNIEEQYKNGIREGYFKNFIIENDEIFICEGRFNNGLKNGQWIINYPNGNPKAILKYYYDIPFGEWKYFYSNGNILSIEKFKEGELHGKIIVFNTKGEYKIKMYFEEGLLHKEFISYHANGKISSLANFYYGKLNGELRLFSTKGITLVEGQYNMNQREGLWCFYYNTGELKSKINYKNGKRNGKSIIYGKGGEILQEIVFINGIEIDEKKEYKNYGDKILEGFKHFTEQLEYKKYDKILSEI
ncbi:MULTISPECIES: toxin-antitoxin system YwqK family antitoxin [Fusobacterium]|uniref:toxin-antitoxin system YwqK family antitoxin n=1 Tax=Fusobacterium TaxID=848 RepID=UPI001476B7C7|nr:MULTISPECIES: toxin-antitoxin system YwqK family antitoxin [Fusobacterium]NME36201.1 toxin-antitoxin system YwqK family antitoxin [Fusobacterium sp. FSA-380-WT-3A]